MPKNFITANDKIKIYCYWVTYQYQGYIYFYSVGVKVIPFNKMSSFILCGLRVENSSIINYHFGKF